MAKNVITEVSVTENGNTKLYAAECPANEEEHQFLHKLTQDLIQSNRGNPVLRIQNTLLAIDRRDVSSITLSISL